MSTPNTPSFPAIKQSDLTIKELNGILGTEEAHEFTENIATAKQFGQISSDE